jgi:hypothetical protein
MPKFNQNYKLALIGLIILFAVSMVMAGGGRPKIEPINASMRQLSANEVMEILQKFPELVPEFLKNDVFDKKDTNLIEGTFRFSVVDVPLLKQFFPTTQFYKGLDGKRPRYPYLMAVLGNKRYKMPSDFNRLLLDNGLEINDKNIIERAKAYVILALGSKPVTVLGKSRSGHELLSFPQITFLEGKRIKEERKIGKKKNVTYTAILKVKVGNEIRNWYLPQDIYEKNQFGGATVTDKDGKVINIYQLLIIETNEKRGGLDLNPGIEIETGTANSNAYIEWETSIPHYYLIVETNGQATNYKVKFNLSGFDANAPNVYIRVRDSILHQNIAMMHIEIDDDGSGDTIWVPGTGSTGIYWVTAGYLDEVYQPVTSDKKLTLEKVVSGTFSGDTTFKIYFCHQFFVNHPQGQSHAPIFAGYVKDAAIETWQKQVNGLNFSKLLIEDIVSFKSLLTTVLEDVIL